VCAPMVGIRASFLSNHNALNGYSVTHSHLDAQALWTAKLRKAAHDREPDHARAVSRSCASCHFVRFVVQTFVRFVVYL